MTPRQIQALLKKLPENQREIGEAKIRQANMLGFTRIEFFEDEKGKLCQHRDLVGINPANEFDFLPEPERTGA